VEFLEWLRETTERAWRDAPEYTLADRERAGLVGAMWRRGTRWTGGLSQTEIDAIETRHGLSFPSDYRLFLSVLHATTPRRIVGRFVEGDRVETFESPGFFDWRTDGTAVDAAVRWQREGLMFDVEHSALWKAGWGHVRRRRSSAQIGSDSSSRLRRG
jgi:hypothetical protein